MCLPYEFPQMRMIKKTVQGRFAMNRRKQRLALACPTLEEALDRYAVEISIKKKGADQERSIANIWKRTLLKKRRLNRITQKDMLLIRDEWLQDRAPATVTRRLALLSNLYTVASKSWQIPDLINPAKQISWPVADDARERRPYDRIRHRGIPAEECPQHELLWILRATRSKTLPVVIVLAVETMMRRSEIINLTGRQINFSTSIITLHDTKNGETRYVPLTPFAKEVLRSHMDGKQIKGKIFSISASGISQSFSRAVRIARRQYETLCLKYGKTPNDFYFRDLRFHDLRHESASRWAPFFTPGQFAKFGGWKTPRMPMRYHHPRGRDLLRQMNKSPIVRKQRAVLRAGGSPFTI